MAHGIMAVSSPIAAMHGLTMTLAGETCQPRIPRSAPVKLPAQHMQLPMARQAASLGAAGG